MASSVLLHGRRASHPLALALSGWILPRQALCTEREPRSLFEIAVRDADASKRIAGNRFR